jgi:hypothetical protein
MKCDISHVTQIEEHAWVGHVAHIEEVRNSNKILARKPKGRKRV